MFTYLVKPFRETDVGPAVRAAHARHEELLAARRQVGEQPLRPVVVGLRSSSGAAWPALRIGRDGVTVVEEAD